MQHLESKRVQRSPGPSTCFTSLFFPWPVLLTQPLLLEQLHKRTEYKRTGFPALPSSWSEQLQSLKISYITLFQAIKPNVPAWHVFEPRYWLGRGHGNWWALNSSCMSEESKLIPIQVDSTEVRKLGQMPAQVGPCPGRKPNKTGTWVMWRYRGESELSGWRRPGTAMPPWLQPRTPPFTQPVLDFWTSCPQSTLLKQCSGLPSDLPIAELFSFFQLLGQRALCDHPVKAVCPRLLPLSTMLPSPKCL